MRFFTNKSIWSKIIIILIFVLLFEFVVAKPTLGAEVTDAIVEGGGVLLKPIMSLVVTLGDSIMTMMQSVIMGTDATIMPVDVNADFWTILGQIVTAAVTVLAAIAVVVGAVVTGGGALAVIGAIAGQVFPILATGAVIGAFVVPAVTSTGTASMSSASASVFPDSVKVPSTLNLPVFNYSPEEIFQGKILLFNVDFFGKPIEIEGPDEDGNYYYTDDDNNKQITSKQNIAADLSSTVSKWYVSIRNIALVCMMIVLLYIGIRMLISTLASDKAKYRQLLQDWLVGVVILFLMHYIMAFSVTLVQQLTKIVSTSVDENVYAVMFPVDDGNKIEDWFKKYDMEYMLYDKDGKSLAEDGAQEAAYVMYPTNLLGQLRLNLQFDTGDYKYAGYAICYLVLVFFTVYFTFIYLKRVLYMAFLTLIAPVVAVTYPIDKINDGSAQGFQRWFREYIFNLLIQPMHLLLYFILITSAFSLAGENIIYSLVAIGFMIPAEKLLRTLFGFEKASTPSAVNGAAGGALAMAGINGISRMISSHEKRNVSSGGNGGGNTKIASSKQLGNILGDKKDDIIDETAELAGKPSNPQLRMLQDDLDAEGITPQDPEYAQMVRERGFTPEDLDNFNKEKLENLNNNNGNSANSVHVEGTQEEEKQVIPEPNSTIRMADNEGEFEKEPTARLEPQEGQSKGKKIITGIKRAGNWAGRNTVKYGMRYAPKVLKATSTIAKPTARVVGGIVAASAGAAAGIASGDPSDVLRNATAGAGAGYMAGVATANSISAFANETEQNKDQNLIALAERSKNEKFIKMARDEVLRGRREEYRKAFRKNNYSKDDFNKLIEDGTIDRYIVNDIDAQNAVAAEGYRKETGASQKKAMAVAKTFDRVGDSYKGADSAKWKRQFSSEYQDKANLDKADADQRANETWSELGKFRKQRKKYIE